MAYRLNKARKFRTCNIACLWRADSVSGYYYPWVEEEGYIYFRKRLSEARRDVEHGLEITLDYYKTRKEQERMLEILKFKLEFLVQIVLLMRN
jgi:pyrroloquinoline quinone (PQQ) biosynthesis protein C